MPFVVTGAVGLTAIALFVLLILRNRDFGSRKSHDDEGVRAVVARLVRLIRENRPLQAYMVANALWELSLGALKTFIVLYITKGLGHSLSRDHGSLTGFYSLSRGIGTMLGPLFAGIAVQVLKGPFADTEGYAAMWIVCSAGILLSIPFLLALRDRVKQDRRPA